MIISRGLVKMSKEYRFACYIWYSSTYKQFNAKVEKGTVFNERIAAMHQLVLSKWDVSIREGLDWFYEYALHNSRPALKHFDKKDCKFVFICSNKLIYKMLNNKENMWMDQLENLVDVKIVEAKK